MNFLTFARLSLLLGPLYLFIEYRSLSPYGKTNGGDILLYIFMALSLISLVITSYVDHKINVKYKHHMNISLIIIPYIIYACKSTHILRGLPLNLSMLIFSSFIIGHILFYYMIFTTVKEKYERYYGGLPLFTPEEKQSYMEIFIKHYCKKDEKCCSCDCKCKSKCK